MTSRINEIQGLIVDIDSLLNNKNNLLSRLISTQGQEAKAILEKIRDFLVRLDSSETQPEPYTRSPLIAKFADRERYSGEKSLSQYTEVSALLQPLHTELQVLLQERVNLVQEIKKLEQKRLHSYSVVQQMENQEKIISGFLQELIHRIEEKLSFDPPISTKVNELEAATHIDQLQHLANDLESRLIALDGTVNIVFQGLQRNIYTYHESLSQAIDRMHSKGTEGEQLFTALIDNLTGLMQHKNNMNSSELDVLSKSVAVSSSLSTPKSNFDGENYISTKLNVNNSEYLLKSEDSYDISVKNHDVEIQHYQPISLDLEKNQTKESVGSSNQNINAPDFVSNDGSPGNDSVDELYACLFSTTTESQTNTELINPSKTTSISIRSSEEPPEPKIHFGTLELDTIANSSNLMSEKLHQTQMSNIYTDGNTGNFPGLGMWFNKTDDSLLGTNQINSAIPQGIIKKNEISDVSKNITSDIPEATQKSVADISSQISLTRSSHNITELTNQESIETLNDLFVEIEVAEDITTEKSSVLKAEIDERIPANTSVEYNYQPLITNSESGCLKESSDHPVLSTLQEDLFKERVNRKVEFPEISLDKDNLQQVAQDLERFDNEFKSQGNFSSEIRITKQAPEIFLENQEKQVDNQIQEITPAKEKFTSWEKVSDPKVLKNTSVVNSTVRNHKANYRLSVFNPINTPDVNINTDDGIWYLGLDIGSTGISAVLLNRTTTEMYPIYWSSEEAINSNYSGNSFRLPAEVYIPKGAIEKPRGYENSSPPEQLQNIFSAQLKPYLQVAIPYENQQQKWEPFLEINDYSTVPLIWVVRSLSKLLLTLKSDSTSTTPGLMACAVGIKQQRFHQIINNIAGVICNCPANGPEQYRFNLREALITGEIVQHPQQVFFIEDVIANLLITLNNPPGQSVKLNAPNTHHSDNHPLKGNTLIINIGAKNTEMGLTDVPDNLLELNHDNFILHGFAYAGQGIEQDIISQLLLPEKWREPRQTNIEGINNSSSDPLHWKTSIPGLEKVRWNTLRLAELKLPQPGELDIPERIQLQRRLESSLLGKALLDAAVALKLILQHQESFVLELADQCWKLQRRDLESQIFVPFIRRLNRELNKVLVTGGIPTEAINQAILTGGVASITSVAKWLRQKLPNAKIIQNSYLGDDGSPKCSYTAYGLALLPFYPQVLDIPRQQYTDYFLFTEMLRLLPDNRSVSFSEIIQLLESRGINTRICQKRLLAFLEGEVPAGLLPSKPDYNWLAPISQENSFYNQLATTSLFTKQGCLYFPNSQQIESLLTYLGVIQTSNQQSLEEPYTVNFPLGIAV
ncbi:FIG00874454: hypothetical protein [Richelia intracellularis HM01]|nr:hypothetical protein [Richelia intracellularis]CCH65288.1 FIG00874454: hypothetical protein [Richelia intracellularis HM01]